MEVPMLLLTLLVSAVVSPWKLPAALAACQRQCGGVDIPYPFGIGRGCYLDTGDRSFELACSNRSSDGLLRPVTVVEKFEVLHIDELRGKMRVRSPISSSCPGNQSTLTYDSSVFRVSGADNRLVVVGCNASAYVDMWDSEFDNSYRVACHAVCVNGSARPLAMAGRGSSCNGTDGCCQAPIPPRIMYFSMGFDDEGNSSDVSTAARSSACSYAMLVEEAAFESPVSNLTAHQLLGVGGQQVSAVLDWTAGKERCWDAQRNTTAYACASDNSECVDSDNGTGYLCSCAKGYQGNPYLPGGCQDINECQGKGVNYPCSKIDICRNTPGGYKCHEFKWLVAIGVSIVVVALGIGMSCTYAIREKRRLDAIKRRHFKQHGGFLLFEEMKSRHRQGGHLSFTLFTKEELEEATNKFDDRHVLGNGGNGTVYRGELRDGRVVAIKRCRVAADERQRREFGKEVLILSQVNHRGIVKLYGCCLEVEVPMLVYEFIPNGTLYNLIHGSGGDNVINAGDQSPPPPFAVRLKIAHEAAEALAYLHSTASPPIVHGDVKSPNILLDEGYAAKVSDFGASSAMAAAADGAHHIVTLVQGTCGYLDPEYMQTCRLTDRSDVYSFGVVLLELLTQRKALDLAAAAPDGQRSLAAHFLAKMRDGKLDELVDPRIKGEEVSCEVLEMVAALAKRCLEMSGEKRPSMREVAEEIGRVRKLMCRHDIACSLGEIGHCSIAVSDR